jgi:DtxR family Mn-dependent transcriptional regulator
VEKLKDLGLVEHKHYSYVTLTEKGKNLVFELNTIHYAIKELFVKVLGLEENIADQDACNLEHHISPQSLIALRKMVTFLNTCPKNISSWLKIFHNCRFFTEKSDSCQQCEIMQGENL